jgi:hypothetical protein
MHSQPRIRARGYAQSGPPRPHLFGGVRHPLPSGLDTPRLGGHPVELGRFPRPPQHIDPIPDPDGAHALYPRSQAIRRGQPSLLPRKMAG